MKILFVDDDAIARRNIITRINWVKYGWELIYVARDGVDALEFMKDNQPNVILSDIKMPIMDGIEMAMISRDYYPDIKFIFLSGYKDFEYAKQALKLNAIDYLTKPLDTEQLISVLKRTENLLQKEQEENNILQEKYPLIKRQYISKLLQEHFKEVDNSVFKAFDINMTSGLGIVGFIKCSIQETSLLSSIQLQEICNIMASRYPGSFFFCMDNLQIFMVFTNKQCADEFTFHKYIKELESFFNLQLNTLAYPKVTFHYGSIMHSLTDFYQSYQLAQQNMNSEIDNLLLNIKKYIETNYSNSELTLLQIAHHFNLNHCYLTSLFKEKFGINLYDYLIQVRMEKAGEMIRTTQLKSYEIASYAGYKNSQYFSVSFKKYFNCTVTQYREQSKEVQYTL